MLSSVLRSERAVLVNIAIMRAFVRLRSRSTRSSKCRAPPKRVTPLVALGASCDARRLRRDLPRQGPELVLDVDLGDEL